MSVEQLLVKAWHRDSWWLLFLRPLALLFRGLAQLRRRWLQSKFQGLPFAVPVVVVGNLSVGGSGKTPLVVALVKALAERGLKAGVVSRGYGGRAAQYPVMVSVDSVAAEVGDEPLLIAQQTVALDCPVVVDPNRHRGVEFLLASAQVDLILTDDGLQHYGLYRDVEIAVIDGARGLGNQRTLPAGPLREPVQRLSEVDFVLVNGAATGLDSDSEISIQASAFRHFASGSIIALDAWAESRSVHAVAAIGNPERFAKTLEGLGFELSLVGKNDHQPLSLADISFNDQRPVIITAKDAVKFIHTAPYNLWVLEVEMIVESAFVDRLVQRANLFSEH